MSATCNRTLVLGLALLFLLGSGPRAMAGDEIAVVEGKVSLDGKPLTSGRIIFHQDNGQFIGAKINKDGTFKVDRVLVGKHRVTVEAKGVPEKYASEEVTALRVEVQDAKNVFNFELTS